MTQKRFNKLRMTLFAQMYADAKKGYETREEAEKDLKKDISYKWSFEARIREVYVK